MTGVANCQKKFNPLKPVQNMSLSVTNLLGDSQKVFLSLSYAGATPVCAMMNDKHRLLKSQTYTID